MAVIGDKLSADTLMLTLGRDFKWNFENLDEDGNAIAFPTGELFFELATSPDKTQWAFDIDGSVAALKVESEAADLIAAGTKWQLVFLPTGESAGGDAIALGSVKRQG